MKLARKPTRDRIVEAGLYLFWLQGYAATGMAEILARAEANAGSFYHFFKTKEELLLAVLELYIQSLEPVVVQPVLGAIADPVERIFGILEFYRRNLLSTGCTYGCPIGRLALEIPEEQFRVHKRLADNFDGWTAAIEKCLEDARWTISGRDELRDAIEVRADGDGGRSDAGAGASGCRAVRCVGGAPAGILPLDDGAQWGQRWGQRSGVGRIEVKSKYDGKNQDGVRR